jgi:ribosomal protein S14
MEDIKYVECQKCGTIHYVIEASKNKTSEGENIILDDFSSRDLTRCSKCGSKDSFIKISEEYADEYSNGDNIPPIMI